MKIALAQINTTVGDIRSNLARAIQAYSGARLRGADLVVFPELTLTGYPPEDLLYREDFIQEAHQALAEFSAHTTRHAVIGTVFEKDGLLYNAAVMCHDGAMVGWYAKENLPNYGVFDERRYFAKGNKTQRDLFTVNGKTIALSICEDAWVVDSRLYDQGKVADLLVNLSASPYHANKTDERGKLFSAISKVTGTPLVYCNLVGGQDELVFDGNSLAFDDEGVLIGSGLQFMEDIVYVDYALGDEKETDFGQVWTPMEPMEEIYNALVLGTRDYLRKNGFHRALIGLSGGIDSALVAAIAAEALGPENVIGVTMPSRFSSKGSLTDSWALAKNIGIKTIEIPIEAAHMAYDAMLLPAYDILFPTSPARNEDENVQARIRGTTLMALANRSGAIVLTTGNKSEMAMGYATLYGDMAGGFAVIKDVPKTTVFALCRWLNTFPHDTGTLGETHEEIIPQTIIQKPPSAELRPDQKDTDSLPEYDILDPIIEGFVEQDLCADDLIARGYSRSLIVLNGQDEYDLVNRVCRAITLNEYKRRQSPPGIRISPKAFGKDRRLPIANGWIK